MPTNYDSSQYQKLKLIRAKEKARRKFPHLHEDSSGFFNAVKAYMK